MTGTVVVFGAGGFLGGHVAEALAADGWNCTGVDRRGRATDGGHVTGPYYSGHDWSSAALSRFLRARGPAVIVNAVGAPWAIDPSVVRRDNVVWPCRLAEACELSGTAKSLVHLGSSHEYGDTVPGIPVSESTALAPTTEYGKSKVSGASYLVRAAYRTRQPLTLVRAFNVIGPGHGRHGLWAAAAGLYRAATAAGHDRVVANVPRPETVRDLVDVRDVARLVALAARRPGPPVAVYNAASGTGTSIEQLFEAFAKQTGVPCRFVPGPGGLRTGSTWQHADISRATTRLGWTRRYTLADSIGAALGRAPAVAPG
ncbi:NAD-dependent epimerase/dehydratase family protein [Streptomyces sedi]|uniref:NAD(P)-dependent oxidoreductase n=1 Tax=Streptomyces sedi TaxID=555059 RepID=A0A5C4VED4_9ACTN|nr:NAD(P)-dependent oxidoreductase [Streptomyces sedi]TNM34297.1 NAD(P)-dependent oxidoreductase [Streptomyces sedi]